MMVDPLQGDQGMRIPSIPSKVFMMEPEPDPFMLTVQTSLISSRYNNIEMQESFTHNAPIFEIDHSSVGDEDESADIAEEINNRAKRFSAQPPEIAEEYKTTDRM